MALNYTKKTIDNFLKPKNVGSIKKPDGYAQIGNMVCGDQLDFFLKVEKGIIKDVKFLSFGCASNIATASILTEKVKGMKVADAKKYKWDKVVSDLGGLPRQKVHCSIMAVEGLQKAISDYEAKQKMDAEKIAKPIIKKVAKSSVKAVSKNKAVKVVVKKKAPKKK